MNELYQELQQEWQRQSATLGVADKYVVSKQQKQQEKQFFTELGESLRGFAISLTKDEDAAEDLLQEAFMAIYKKRHDKIDNVRALARSVIYNRFLDLYVRKKSPTVTESLPDHSSDDDQARTFQDKQLLELIKEPLKDGEKEIIALYLLGYEKPKEIAGVLDISNEAAQQRLSRLRKRMRAEVERLKKTEYG